MQVLKGEDDLSTVELRDVVWKLRRLAEVCEQLATGHVLEEDVQAVVVCEAAQHVDDEGVCHLAEDGCFGKDVVHLLHADDLLLFKHFQCVVLWWGGWVGGWTM